MGASLYQINTRIWLTALAQELRRPATLDDLPDLALDRFAEMGFDWIWLLSIWQTGPASQRVSRTNPIWLREFQETLPDLAESDIPGSGFAITDYTVHEELGGDAALARLRQRLRQRGLRLMLDFVPNHTGLDHRWIEDHPEHYIQASELDFARAPMNYARISRRNGDLILAHGRDPNFPGWPDTLQLNYGNPATHEAMKDQLLKIAGQCDGIRCDMAMLLLPDVFERTWSIRSPSFWPDAIARVRAVAPNFCFLAEAYWNLEWTLQQQGFDYTYDKYLYDLLREGNPQRIREHLHAGLDFQNKLARFLENHDENRAAAIFPQKQHEAAAIIAFLSPGLRFFHQGEFEGRLKRISVHLGRAPNEPVDGRLREFYFRLLDLLKRPVVRQGEWRLLDCTRAWEGNNSGEAIIAFSWHDTMGARLLVTVNYASHPSQCHVQLPFGDLSGRQWRLRDLLGEAVYERDGKDLTRRGLYLDVPGWQYHVFELTTD